MSSVLENILYNAHPGKIGLLCLLRQVILWRLRHIKHKCQKRPSVLSPQSTSEEAVSKSCFSLTGYYIVPREMRCSKQNISFFFSFMHDLQTQQKLVLDDVDAWHKYTKDRHFTMSEDAVSCLPSYLLLKPWESRMGPSRPCNTPTWINCAI